MNDPLDAVFVTDKDEAQRLKQSRQLVALAKYIDSMPMELKPLFKERFSLVDNAELAQLRADLQAAQERIAQLEAAQAFSDAEQARQLDEARDIMIAVMPYLPISGDGYNTRHPARISIDAWLAANPAPQEQQP